MIEELLLLPPPRLLTRKERRIFAAMLKQSGAHRRPHRQEAPAARPGAAARHAIGAFLVTAAVLALAPAAGQAARAADPAAVVMCQGGGRDWRRLVSWSRNDRGEGGGRGTFVQQSSNEEQRVREAMTLIFSVCELTSRSTNPWCFWGLHLRTSQFVRCALWGSCRLRVGTALSKVEATMRFKLKFFTQQKNSALRRDESWPIIETRKARSVRPLAFGNAIWIRRGVYWTEGFTGPKG